MAKQNNGMIFLLLGVGAYFLLRKPAIVAASTLPATRPPASNRSTTGSISLSGSSYVKWYQAALNDLVGANLALDGISGPLTQAAIKTFQQTWGITADGIVGPETEYYINSALGMPGYTEAPYGLSCAVDY